MGVVVAAHHMQLDEKVALKFLLPEALGDAEAVARFAREARNAVKIKSEHVARVTDVGTLPNGAPYMVMEYLDGGDLAAWVKQRGALPIEQAIEFVLQACVALAEAHALGIVHRDLKPANLFCIRRADGQLSIKVLDFGISKLTDRIGPISGTLTAQRMAFTKTSALMGSPFYMSPEQMRSAKDVDAQTDIWALGVILFELVTGRPPFQAESVTELAIKVDREPTPAIRSLCPDVPNGLDAIVFKCLEKDRHRRYLNVAELALALLPLAPKRAKASVERISGIIQAAGLSASALAVPPSPQVVDETSVSGGTLPPVGRTTIGATSGKTAVVGAGVLGTLALAGGVTFAVLSKTVPEHHDEPPAASHPVALRTVSLAVVTASPVTDETSTALPDAPAAPTASTRAVSPLTTAAVTPSNPSRTPKTVPAPFATAATPGTATAAPTPSCTVATDYDSDGQPHFRKVCK
jgi:eukaryotic-like serine/threonine-protein kinase